MPDDARHTRIVASDEDRGTRLDQFIAQHLPAVSRSQAHRLIRDGHVHLESGRVKPSWLVEPGLVVDIDFPAPTPAQPAAEALALTVLYEDEDLAVVDKPSGMVVHPGAGHAKGTLVNALLHHLHGLSGVGGEERPGIVHRLDRGTSGVMVVAKHDRAHQELARQFQQRQVGKEYLALVWGTAHAGETMEQPIGRHPRHRQKMSSRARKSRPAATHILDAEALGGVSLIRVSIGTGRTHQIRVHLSEAGHAVVGDPLYGGVRPSVPPRLLALRALARPFLHATRLTFAHPADGRPMAFEVPLPPDLADVLARLRRATGRAS